MQDSVMQDQLATLDNLFGQIVELRLKLEYPGLGYCLFVSPAGDLAREPLLGLFQFAKNPLGRLHMLIRCLAEFLQRVEGKCNCLGVGPLKTCFIDLGRILFKNPLCIEDNCRCPCGDTFQAGDRLLQTNSAPTFVLVQDLGETESWARVCLGLFSSDSFSYLE